MTDKVSSKRTRPPAGGGGGEIHREAQARINPAFDDWLEKKLHNIFDSAAMEPIPKDLLKLLEKLDNPAPPKKEKP